MASLATVLVVDDDDDMRMLIRMVVEADGDLEVVGEAIDGPDALAAFELLNPPPVPHVIVLDHNMPGLTGLEVAKRVEKLIPGQRIILCTAYANAELRRDAAALGIAQVVSKPDIAGLPALIRSLAA